MTQLEIFYCEECGLERETRVIDRDLTLPVMGEEITVRAPRRECVVCGTWLGDSDLDSPALQKAYDVYRVRTGIAGGGK